MQPDYKILIDFIDAHRDDSADALLLSRNRFPGVDMDIVVNTLRGRERMKRKFPQWYDCKDLIYPTALCTQQCSSRETAFYKASAALALLDSESGNASIADLTGGLGADSYAFSKKFSKVLYNEADKALARAAEWNFERLGAGNIDISDKFLKEGNIKDILGDFKPDILYLDPSRRAGDGRKVFLLEDCSPDILKLKDELLEVCKTIFVKLSPMADISRVCSLLGSGVAEVHVVASGGECKELLVAIKKDFTGTASLHIYEEGEKIYLASCEDEGVLKLFGSPGELEACTGKLLFEPGKALLKAGLFKYPCSLGYRKLGASTHIYIAGDSTSGRLPGKYFTTDKIMPMTSSALKSLSKASIKAEVSTHNIPVKAEELKKRLRASSSSSCHLFACKADFVSGKSSNYLIFASRES